MISGVTPGTFASPSTFLFAKSVISVGRDDLGSPFDNAAAAILLGRSFEIREWKIALSKTIVSTQERFE